MTSTVNGWEVRWEPDMGETEDHPDEVVGIGFVHVERLSEDSIWIGLGDNKIHVNLYAVVPKGKRKPVLRMRVERYP